jgi:hypothetical protein
MKLELKEYRNELQTQVDRLQRLITSVDGLMEAMAEEGASSPVANRKVRKAPKATSVAATAPKRRKKKCVKCGRSPNNCARYGCCTGKTPALPAKREDPNDVIQSAAVTAATAGEWSVSDKIRAAYKKCGEPFQARDVREVASGMYPEWGPVELGRVSGYLNQMAGIGELKREGTGCDTQYRMGTK